jgi:superkiller protein 3
LDEQGKHAEAEAAYRKAIAINPNYPWPYVHIGVHLVNQEKWEEAEAAFRKAISLHYNVAFDAYKNLGDVLVRQGKWAEAEAAYRKAILFKFDDAEIHSRLGHLLQSQGKLKDAIPCYQEAAFLRLDCAPYHHQLAWLLATRPTLKLRDPGQALEHAKQAVELAPSEAMSWKTLGVAQYRNGALKSAIAALMKSVQLHKEGDGFTLFFLAMAHWQLDEKDKARAWYDRAVAWMDKNDPQNKELNCFRAEATALLGLAKAIQTQKQKE